MSKATKPDKTRQLSIEQANAIEHLLQGQSDRAVAEAVGMSRTLMRTIFPNIMPVRTFARKKRKVSTKNR